MALPESFIQELLSKNDIESVASSYVAFKRRGRNLVGLCPFHSEKTGSFYIYPNTQSFYCFGCGAGGDTISFLRRIENLEYIEAVKLLAERGVDAALVSFHTLKPFDDALALEWAQRCGKVFTVEEHSVIGGLGDAVASAICGKGTFSFTKIGIEDRFGQSGKPADLLKEYGLTGPQIAQRVLEG